MAGHRNMPLSKQAKILSKGQVLAAVSFLEKTRHSTRNTLIFLLSLRAGLRAHEIAHLRRSMVTDGENHIAQAIQLWNEASKGSSGRIIPMSVDLRRALHNWFEESGNSEFVITTERSQRTSAQAIVNMFGRWYEELGFVGCSSHSGRRTFITNAARKIASVGGSIRDVQILAGHADLRVTQRYIDADAEAQRRVVEIL
jgi:integrase/recombinase XerD